MAISGTHGNASHFLAGVERGHPHEVLRAGALGAVVVWVWIFFIGALNGAPLRLATLIGSGLMHVVRATSTPEWVAVVVFTVFHFVVWFGLAGIMAVVLKVAMRTPAVLMLAAVVSILLLLALVGITMIFASDGLGGGFAWPAIYVGSILGLAATSWYLIRWHPEVRSELAHVDDDS
ncbi:MAG TPA: hypothetical protein VFK39_08225 [Gemmatimonadaceae bacterium]|nr:hypothetical protein [Gemmatimonadaceae bacterium]